MVIFGWYRYVFILFFVELMENIDMRLQGSY